MLLFVIGVIVLIIGYFTYGNLAERIFAPDGRTTPAVASSDGVDYVVLPHWKNMLIQLLNIAGVGPVIGVILGIKFGAVVFIIIPIGNVIGGAIHDFASGMMSIRNRGANLPKLIQMNLGETYYRFFSWFMIFLLLLVVAVFVNIPANLINLLVPGVNIFWVCVAAVFMYYIVATLLPVDKIIGKIYPFFAILLMIGTLAMIISLIFYSFTSPIDILSESEAFKAGRITQPIIPCLFITIACGIISGFHASQSPIIARTMVSERQAKSSFYGMMIAEGIIAMVWSAAGMAIYNIFPELMQKNPTLVLVESTKYFLGSYIGILAVIAVIILSITSGDTAMRSMRLSLSEMLGIDQKPFIKRFLLTLPLVVLSGLLIYWSNLSAKTFGYLWNYFSWANQILAASTLMAGSAWLIKQKKNPLIVLLPGMFMTFIVTSFILWTSTKHGGPMGLGLEINYAYTAAAFLTVIFTWFACRQGKAGSPVYETPFSENSNL